MAREHRKAHHAIVPQDRHGRFSKRAVRLVPLLWKRLDLGVLLLLVFAVLPSIKRVNETVWFPPDWREMTRLIVIPLGVATWWLTRELALRLSGHNQAAEHDATPPRQSKMIVLTIAGFIGVFLVLAMYMNLYDEFVCHLPGEQEHTVLPMWDAKFWSNVEIRGGKQNVIDNDTEWLKDQLHEAAAQGVSHANLAFVGLGFLFIILLIIATGLATRIRRTAPTLHEVVGALTERE